MRNPQPMEVVDRTSSTNPTTRGDTGLKTIRLIAGRTHWTTLAGRMRRGWEARIHLGRRTKHHATEGCKFYRNALRCRAGSESFPQTHGDAICAPAATRNFARPM